MIESLTTHTKLQASAEPLTPGTTCGVQAYFMGTAHRAGDIPKIAVDIGTSPVPVNLVRRPSNFWAGKADVPIILTRPESALLQYPIVPGTGCRVRRGVPA
ncbi:hypothetical protein [Microtetraspora glauca]|uniref:Uncharacterized protein n=1 Tax=Microtetraspora glauca TaxID=1996 RepID=A0ABV3GTB6_MICGL